VKLHYKSEGTCDVSITREREKAWGKVCTEPLFMISKVVTTRCNIFCSNFSSKCLRVLACSVGIYRAFTCNLKSYMDCFIRHPSGSRVPMRRDPWTGL